MNIITPAATLPPPLAHDAMMQKEFGRKVGPNGRIERLVFWNFCAHLAANGWNVQAVDDGEELTRVADARAAMELAFNLDECRVQFGKGAPTRARHRVLFIMGNGSDLVSDWGYTEGDADGFNAVLEAFDSDAVIAACTTAALDLAATPREPEPVRLVRVHVRGRRWFQRSAGNTYSSAAIVATFSDGSAQDFTMAKQYGYGDYYMQASADILEAAGLMPERVHYQNGGAEPLWQYCNARNIALDYSAQDVTRERDLH